MYGKPDKCGLVRICPYLVPHGMKSGNDLGYALTNMAKTVHFFCSKNSLTKGQRG